MLTTSRGTVTTARGTPAPRPSAPPTTSMTHHFVGEQATRLDDGRWRLELDVAPLAVDQVDFDGALLYLGQSPGFAWEGDCFVDLELPTGTFCPSARVHIRYTVPLPT